MILSLVMNFRLFLSLMERGIFYRYDCLDSGDAEAGLSMAGRWGSHSLSCGCPGLVPQPCSSLARSLPLLTQLTPPHVPQDHDPSSSQRSKQSSLCTRHTIIATQPLPPTPLRSSPCSISHGSNSSSNSGVDIFRTSLGMKS